MPPIHPISCRRLYVIHWTAPWLVLPRSLSIETGFETQFATLVPTAPPRILPRARAAQTSTLTWGFVVVLVGIWHSTVTCGRLGEAKATPNPTGAQAALTHTRTQFNQKSIMASKYQIHQIQSNSIRFDQGNPPACYPSWDRGQAR